MNRRALLISIGLAAMTCAVYSQISQCQFLIYDDPQYVSENRWVMYGFTHEGVIRAFTTSMAANWHPMTWLSHMLDVSLFGLAPGPHHLVNLLIHVLNVLVLFRLLDRMTNGKVIWRCAFSAALFAIHPLHVESVAWIAERKDLLCAFFGLLALWHYTYYVKTKSRLRYGIVFVLFVLGLMSKPMLVTLPFLMLLLDYWPLDRFDRISLGAREAFTGLLIEKIPMMVLSILSSVLTLWAQNKGEALIAFDALPLWARIGNALTAYLKYMGKMYWPSSLAVFYPNPGLVLPPWEIAGAACLLIAITGFAVRFSRTKRYLPVGWFWFLGSMVPVIGLIQVGSQAMADRYTYLPMTGLFLIIAWGTADAWERYRLPKNVLACLAVSIICLLSLTTWKQVGYWRSNYTLFGHMIRVVPKWNRLGHINMGGSYLNDGNPAAAVGQFAQALHEKPDDEMANWGMGIACHMLGRIAEAEQFYRNVLKINPEHTKARLFLGCSLIDRGNFEEGYKHVRIVAQNGIVDDPYVLMAKGMILFHDGRMEESIRTFQDALVFTPNDILGNMKLGLAFAKTGRYGEAIERFRSVTQYSPLDASAYYNLALALEKTGAVRDAVANYEKAAAIRPADVEILGNLGIALGKLGRLDQAIVLFRKALKIDPANSVARGNLAIALTLKERERQP